MKHESPRSCLPRSTIRRPSPSRHELVVRPPTSSVLEPSRIERRGSNGLITDDERRHLFRARRPEDHPLRTVPRRDQQSVGDPPDQRALVGRNGRTPDHVASTGASPSAGRAVTPAPPPPSDVQVVRIRDEGRLPQVPVTTVPSGAGWIIARPRASPAPARTRASRSRAARARSPSRVRSRRAGGGHRSGSSDGTAAVQVGVDDPAAPPRSQRDPEGRASAADHGPAASHHDVAPDEASSVAAPVTRPLDPTTAGGQVMPDRRALVRASAQRQTVSASGSVRCPSSAGRPRGAPGRAPARVPPWRRPRFDAHPTARAASAHARRSSTSSSRS